MAPDESNSHVLGNHLGVAAVGIMILLLGVVSLLAAPAAAQGPPGEINVSSEGGTTPPGESVEVNTTVTNEGDRTLTGIEVWVTDSPANWTASNSTIERLKPDQSTTVSLNISVPRDEESESYTLTVRAESPENVSGESTMEIVVQNPSASPGTPSPTESGDQTGNTETPTPTPTPSCDGKEILDWCIPWPDFSWPDFSWPDIF